MLILDGRTLKDVAKEIGVHYQTVRSWQTDMAFQDLYRQYREVMVENLIATIMRKSEHAINKLVEEIDAEIPSKTRVQACDTLLKHVSRFLDRRTKYTPQDDTNAEIEDAGLDALIERMAKKQGV